MNKVHPSLLKKIGFRISARLDYRIAVPCVLFVVFVLGMTGLKKRADSELTSALTWPSANAEVITSDVRLVYQGDYTGYSALWSVAVELKYLVGDRPYFTKYKRVFVPYTVADFRNFLKEGQEIEIRYSPNNSNLISLHPLIPEGG